MSGDVISRVCAIHQPNLFARRRTLDKLLAADIWIVLNDVQFCRRDYQHRARIGRSPDPQSWQWLTVPVRLPDGRATHIRDVRIADRPVAQRRITALTRQHYRRAPNWDRIADIVDTTAAALGSTDSLADIAEHSVTAMLRANGWTGTIVRSADLAQTSPVRTGRSERLVDLARATGSTHYLCGRGGLRYLDKEQFSQAGITVERTTASLRETHQGGLDDLSALTSMAESSNHADGTESSKFS